MIQINLMVIYFSQVDNELCWNVVFMHLQFEEKVGQRICNPVDIKCWLRQRLLFWCDLFDIIWAEFFQVQLNLKLIWYDTMETNGGCVFSWQVISKEIVRSAVTFNRSHSVCSQLEGVIEPLSAWSLVSSIPLLFIAFHKLTWCFIHCVTIDL